LADDPRFLPRHFLFPYRAHVRPWIRVPLLILDLTLVFVLFSFFVLVDPFHDWLAIGGRGAGMRVFLVRGAADGTERALRAGSRQLSE
jgi:hypothetical protein